MLTDLQAMVLRKLPQKIEMVGGPFCGVKLFTRRNMVSDVYAELMERASKGAGIVRWWPVTPREIHVEGVGTIAVYRPRRDGKWLISRLVSAPSDSSV